MTPVDLIAELQRRRLRVVLRPDGGLKLTGPKSAQTPELIAEARRHKQALLLKATADEALSLLRRLRTFTLPRGRLPVARILASRLSSISNMGDDGTAADALEALRNLEIDLLGIGAQPDDQLAAVLNAFPDTQVVTIQ